MKLRVVFLLVCLLLAGACRGCFAPDRHVDRDVAATEIEGTWELTAATLELLGEEGYAPDPGLGHRITFREDGALEFASVLDHFDGPEYVAATGTWSIGPAKMGDSADAAKNAVRIVLDTPTPRTGVGLGIAEEAGGLRLWSFHSDPDLWQFIEYVRVE